MDFWDESTRRALSGIERMIHERESVCHTASVEPRLSQGGTKELA